MSLSLRCVACNVTLLLEKKNENIVLQLFNIIEKYCYGMLEGEEKLRFGKFGVI